MAPVFQALVTLAICILLSLLLLSEMPLAISDNFSHVINILLIILARFFFEFFSKIEILLRPESCPTVSPDPSSLDL